MKWTKRHLHGCEVSHTALFQLHTLLHPAILQRSWGARKDSTSLEHILKTGGNSWLFLCLLVAQIQISVQPQSQQAAVGSRVLLTCRASGPPDLKYQWFRGKEEVRLLPLLLLLFQCCGVTPHMFAINWFCGWSHPQILEETGTTPELILCPLAPVHQGHYICRINSGIKCIFSQWAHLSVICSAGISSHSSSPTPRIT